MLIVFPKSYDTFSIEPGVDLYLADHLNGFSRDLTNPILDRIHDSVNDKVNVYLEYIVNEQIRENYPKLNLKFNLGMHNDNNYFDNFVTYDSFVPPIRFPKRDHLWDNFVCSFNGTKSIGRMLLVSALNRAGLFDERYCSKNFSYDAQEIVSELNSGISDSDRIKLLFFDHEQPTCLGHRLFNFRYTRFDHQLNYYTLKPLILKSFVHVVSETASNSYYPFVTEKFLYSVICKGLFVAYAQPGWHDHLEKKFGFKKYNKIFDYTFDTIEDPIERLLALITMLSKYSKMSPNDWSVLYHLEKDAINYNYNHYYHGKYKSFLMEISEGVTHHGKTV